MADHKMEDMENKSIKNKLARKLSGYDWDDNAVLIHIPQVPNDLLNSEVARNRGYFAYPPQSLLYVAAALRRQGMTPQIVDLNFLMLRAAQNETPDLDSVWKNAIDEAIASLPGPPFIGISFMFSLNRPAFARICEYVKARHPEACVVAGGVGASVEAENIVQEGLVDFVLKHEAETTVSAFFSFLANPAVKLPPNICFMDDEGTIIQTPEQKGGELNIDIRPEFALLPVKEYCRVGSLSNFSRMNGLDIPFATVQSRRGCRARCSFCSVNSFNGKGVRVRPVDEVIEEMAFLYDHYGIRHFDWLDDDFLFHEKKALELLNKMAERLPGITWAANNGLIAAAINDDLLAAMEKSGVIGFRIGLESGNESVLKRVRKPINLKQFFDFSRLAAKYPGIFVGVNLILGFPGENVGQMLDTFQVATQARLDWNNFYLYQPLKDTDLYTAWGGLGNEDRDTGLGRENNNFNLNPVRGGAFRKAPTESVRSGFDIFSLPPDLEPVRQQVNEIWFTFNCVSNFLRLPALRTESEKRLKNAIRWLSVLSDAYPEDAAMKSVLYYLLRRLGEMPSAELNAFRDLAMSKYKNSEYWRYRDRQFRLSAFLDDAIPEIPGFWRNHICNERPQDRLEAMAG